MSADEKIFKFLAQPGNLTIAFQVADALDRMKRQAHVDFWKNFSDYVAEQVASSEFAVDWIFAPIPEDDRRKRWSTCSIRPIRKQSSGNHVLQASMQQSSIEGGFRLLMGVMWHPRLGGKTMQVDVKPIKDLVKEMGYTETSPDWPNWGWIPYTIYSPEFVGRMVNQGDDLVREIGDLFWEFFLKVRPLVESVNQQLVILTES